MPKFVHELCEDKVFHEYKIDENLPNSRFYEYFRIVSLKISYIFGKIDMYQCVYIDDQGLQNIIYGKRFSSKIFKIIGENREEKYNDNDIQGKIIIDHIQKLHFGCKRDFCTKSARN